MSLGGGGSPQARTLIYCVLPAWASTPGVLPWETAPRRVLPILLRSVESLIRTQGIGGLAQIYLLSQRDGLRFHLAYIPASFKAQPQEQFDPVYMRKHAQAVRTRFRTRPQRVPLDIGAAPGTLMRPLFAAGPFWQGSRASLPGAGC